MKNGLRKKLAIICAHASSVVRKGRGGGDLPPLLGGTSPLFSGDLLPGRYATWEVDKRGGRSPRKGGEIPQETAGRSSQKRGGGGALDRGVEVENAGGRRV